MALELVERREQRPRLAVAQAQVPAAAADRGLERDPRLGDAVGLGRRLGRAPAARLHARERVLEHVADAVAALDGLDVPGERDEVAPEAVVGEQLGGGGGVARGQRLLEAREPLVDLGGHGLRRRSRSWLSSKPVTTSTFCPPVVKSGLFVADHTNVDWLLRSRLGSHLFLIAGSAAVPAAALHALTRGG